MNTRPVRVAVIGVVACLLLGGCGADGASPDAVPPTVSSTASPDATGSPSAGAGSKEPGRKKDRAKDQSTGEGTDGATDGVDGSGQSPEPSPSASPDTSSDDSDGDGTDTTAPGSAPALEMPEAPESPVSSLSELLAPTNPAPLVTTPLPRSANAQGRLLRQFPDALRPPRGARVESSSLSPMGDRLQVGLVATTSLSPAQVLIAYRTRLARRGMDETAPPPSVAGSQAASFRRGDSVVTVTVSPRGSGSSYAVHASLRATGG
ncbi:hypothetical protein IEZ26_00735 [Nocardioides cavernae]|uniref:Uncharacterized protein n=1 Tax=Nocardioides cavernae TaxID=1921566 RepID=A0ABR8N7G2_9ACTN|nr:hypothetical protein [Nocardioides cavernae]MBD3923130.1 hypothetical protein [Nocardioides cavernae]MBM7511949.1 hypothetical protein [Nocardioides cavernae]